MSREVGVALLSHPVDSNSEVAVLPITTAVIGFVLGLGGLQELFVRGIWNGELPSLVVGAMGALVSSPLTGRYVGLLAMMLGVGIGIALLAYTIRHPESSPQLVRH